MTLSVVIATVPHEEQRYDTAGDWETTGDTLEITVSELGDWRLEALVAVHELIEALACRNIGITSEKVDAFDLKYEGQDPGSDVKAPYHREHSFAEGIERLLAEKLNVSWGRYQTLLDQLEYSPERKIAYG